MVLFLARPEGGAAPSLMLKYQKSRRRRTALELACGGFDALQIIAKLACFRSADLLTHSIQLATVMACSCCDRPRSSLLGWTR